MWLFFILSGFVLSYGLLKRKENLNAIRTAAVKRYFRLNVPVFFAVMLGYIAMALGAYKAQEFGVSNPFSLIYTKAVPDFWQALGQGLFGSIVYGNTTYNYVLWTISIELYGSFLVFSVIALFGGNINVLRAVCVIIFMCTLHSQDREISSMSLFVAGVVLATLKQDQLASRFGVLSSVILVATSLYLMGYYPMSSSYEGLVKFAALMKSEFGYVTNWARLYPQVGAIILLYSTLLSSVILRSLGAPVFEWLGKVSFSVYLLHSIVLAIVGPYVFLYFSGLQAACVSIALVLPVTLLVSHYYYIYVDSYFTRKINAIFSGASGGLYSSSQAARQS
ncbi:hypothetical protein A0O30_06700 [Pseudomonas sp. LLC-1]|nr:hypothetical protein A0O30_06700 [Pseudomonas sp. LLC-1]